MSFISYKSTDMLNLEIMARTLCIYALLLLTFSYAHAQFDYGNDWYKQNPNQTYIKLLVEEDGIYRISASELEAAGYDLSTAKAPNLQLIYRGREVPIYVGGKSGDSWEFIEFYGKRNDGRVDSIMYRDPQSGLHKPGLQPNIEISLFSDESAYFLTWSSLFGQRYVRFFDPIYTSQEPEVSFLYESMVEYLPGNTGTTYVRGGGGSFDSEYTLNSDYVIGEGYMGPLIQFNSPRNIEIPTPGVIEGSTFSLNARIFHRSRAQHRVQAYINNEINPILDSALASNRIDIQTYRRTASYNLSDITDVRFEAIQSQNDNNNLCWASISYQRGFTLNGDSSILIRNWNKQGLSYFQFQNITGSDSVYVYDLSNPIRSVGLISGSEANVNLPPAIEGRDLLIVTDRGIKKPKIEEHTLSGLFNPNKGAEFVIITHPELEASANAYAAYRDSASSIELSAKVVYTNQIYDEYGYGTITPWAIKRFCKDALDNWQIKPRYFLLWGKGRFLTRDPHPTLVPTFGYPATDYEFVGHYDQNSTNMFPEASIGRVNVTSNEEGLLYLNKVKEYESSGWEPWMKRGVFLGGGSDAAEQNAIAQGLIYGINIFEDIPLGGDAFYFQKSTASIGDPDLAGYHDVISEGTSIIHFFGHSSSNIQDISIREATEYENSGRYPIMIAMGCYGGDFTGGVSFGERWVLSGDRGSIGYLGNSSAGYLTPLRDYSRIFYNIYLDSENLGVPIGDIFKQTITKYTDSINSVVSRNHAKQLNFQGDPAITLYQPDNPDYDISQSDIFFTPDNFSAQDDSFQISIIVNNLGLAVTDSFRISISQRIPDGAVISHPDITAPSTRFRDTLSLMLPNTFGNAIAGENIFEVFVESEEKIIERNENNNRVTLNRVVPGNIPAILFPTKYSIVGQTNIELSASAFFMTQDDNVGYVFEIDTSYQFNSPFRRTSPVVQGSASFSSWPVPYSLEDSTIYYWRVRLADVTPSTWSESSFRYIADKNGWAQADFPQFEESTVDQIQVDVVQQEWSFDNFGIELDLRARRGLGFQYIINGSTFDYDIRGLYQNGLAFIIIDYQTLEVRQDFGMARTGEFSLLRNAILNVRNGDYVIVANNRNAEWDTWTDEMYETLKLIGASDNLRLLSGDDGFVVLGRKGFPNSAVEELTSNPSGSYNLIKRLFSPLRSGRISSTPVGPAKEWETVFWNWNAQESTPGDLAGLSIFAVDEDGRDSLVAEGITDRVFDLSSLNANRHPYLRLEAVVSDSTQRTAPQLDHWHVLFESTPDAVVDVVSSFSFQSDTLDEGQNASISLRAQNYTTQDMDSLLVHYTIERSDRSRTLLDSVRLAPLQNKGYLELNYEFSTLNKGLDADSKLIIELNPDEDQLELHTFNNTYSQDFFVRVDERNPLLDVTFDGKRIMNGDIVSGNPEILVQLDDENPYIALEDSSNVEIYLQSGNSFDPFERISLSDPRLEWIPGQLPDNRARLYFYPGRDNPLVDGEYALRVQGSDQKGNVAGKREQFYEVSFEVVNESSLSQVMNYPNPFSTRTRFVYTLTGSELPEIFQIQIYSVSGKQVRVIDLAGMGDVQLGRNISDFAWDGTDEFGDRLDNGVYIYRVVARLSDGTEIKLRDEGVGQFFNNGWGKMYLMR